MYVREVRRVRRVRRPEDVLLDRRVVDPAGEVEHLAEAVGREVRLERLGRVLQQAREVRQHRRIDELALEGDEELLLAAGAPEVAVADPLACPDEGERVLAVEGVLPGRELEPDLARACPSRRSPDR